MECPSGIGIGSGVDALFATHAVELRRYAQRIVRTRDAAEDVVQDVFLRLWLRRESLELGGGIRSYLFISTRARAIDVLARARRDARRAEHDVPEAERVVDDGVMTRDEEGSISIDAPDDDVIARAVAQVLDAMPPRQRAVATRRLRERRSTADIARELGISPRTVEAHVARATKALRAQLPALLAGNR
jgi:RNA polymerase sigma factor (sigma-70 family)